MTKSQVQDKKARTLLAENMVGDLDQEMVGLLWPSRAHFSTGLLSYSRTDLRLKCLGY